jgi:N-acetylglucosamine transport system substrate-binding protein
MKNSKKAIAYVTLALSTIALLAACGGEPAASSDSGTTSGGATTSKSSSRELWIEAYDGGFGTDWLNNMAKEFTAKTGVATHVEFSTTLTDRIESDLKNGSDFDLYMSHGINWQSFAASGYLANLDDLYETKIDGFDNVTFKDRLVAGAADVSKTEGADGSSHYYKACYTQGAGGFIYNVKMFKDNNWAVPTTYDELVTLCSTINNAKISVGDREYVKPFAWSGADRQYYWDYPMFEWWAQLAGVDKINTIKKYMGPTGKYSDGYEMYNPANYYKEFVEAYDKWWSLIANASANSISTSYSDKLGTAQSAFNAGKAAMIPYAQWGKYELEKTNGGALDFDIAMMKTPKMSASSPDVNYMVGFGDSMIVPAKSSNQDLAKQFLAYMATADGCKTFVKDAKGSFLAFDYTKVDLSDIEATDTYTKSIHEKLSNTNINLTSMNPITVWNTDKVMPWIGNVYYYQKACATPADYTGAKIGATMYNTARSGWQSWLDNAGLSD